MRGRGNCLRCEAAGCNAGTVKGSVGVVQAGVAATGCSAGASGAEQGHATCGAATGCPAGAGAALG